MENLILMTDSYKASHYLQYPPGTSGMFSYLESRGGAYDRTVFFGLQYIVEEYLRKPIAAADVLEAAEFFRAHGEPFPFEQWMRVTTDHGGFVPVRIRAVPEGSVVPVGNVLLTVESTDPELFWMVNWIEALIHRVWYPITVATQSWYVKKTIKAFLDETSDDPAGGLPFKLHDFGSRGVSSHESAMLGGAAHLVNFMGSDTVEGVWMANEYYDCPMAGFSIPAAEHSTITAWGREREADAYRNMVRQFGKPGALFAVVSDSYDVFNAVRKIWGEKLRDEVVGSGATLVVRPDSGDPVTVCNQVVHDLDKAFGSTRNGKGYRVLNGVRVIQGDGVNPYTIECVLKSLKVAGFSADNIAFGMGGALLQKVDRDTQRFAFKCSEVTIDGVARPVFKDPATDPGKRSKAGRLDLVKTSDGEYKTIVAPVPGATSVLRTVYVDGWVPARTKFDEVRRRAARELE